MIHCFHYFRQESWVPSINGVVIVSRSDPYKDSFVPVVDTVMDYTRVVWYHNIVYYGENGSYAKRQVKDPNVLYVFRVKALKPQK